MERRVIRLCSGNCRSPRPASGQANCVNSGAGPQPSIGTRFVPNSVSRKSAVLWFSAVVIGAKQSHRFWIYFEVAHQFEGFVHQTRVDSGADGSFFEGKSSMKLARFR
jgi:hypothetical protein